jgi:phage shock protein PspC (stress-responsive transcriptional regulator)/predicted membrane protein
MIAPNPITPHPGRRQGDSRWRRACVERTLAAMDTNAPPTAPPPPPPPPPPPSGHNRAPHHRAHRALRRDRANGILGGVAAGVAETYGLDVTLVRVLWVVAAVLWIGVPAYIVAWIAIAPADGPRERHRRRRDPGMLVGLVLVAIGIMFASNRLLPNWFRFDHFGAPLLLIGGGLAILFFRRADADDAESDDAVPGVEAEEAETRPVESGPTESETVESRPSGLNDAPQADGTLTPPSAPATGAAAVPPSAWTQTAPWPTPPSGRARRRASRFDRHARRPRPFLTPLTLSVLLIGAGIASLLQATGALDVNLTVVLAIATSVVGAALVTAAFVGRAHSLVLVGIVLLAATAISNTIDVPLRGGIGRRTYRPLQLSELKSSYEVGIGELELDLRDVDLADRTTVVDARTGIGELLVLVPSSVRVEVHAHAGAGSVRLFGLETGGWPENEERAVAGTSTGVLRLDLRVGAGEVRVRRYEPGGIETILGDNNQGGNG